MRISYDSEVDILTLDFKRKRIGVSEEVLPGLIADFDTEGQLVGFEIMDASKITDLSEVSVYLSKWGEEERVVDSDGSLLTRPLAKKSIPAGD